MSRRRQSYQAYQAIRSDDLTRQTFGERSYHAPDDLPAETDIEAEWAQAFGDALLFGAVLIVLGASAPFVLLLVAIARGI